MRLRIHVIDRGGDVVAHARMSLRSQRACALEQALLALRAASPPHRYAGGLRERRLDVDEDRALGARGDKRLRDAVDVDVGAAAGAAVAGRKRYEREDAVGAHPASVAERDETGIPPDRGHRRSEPTPRVRLIPRLVLRLRIEAVERLLDPPLAIGEEDRDGDDANVALGTRDHETELVLVLGLVDLARVVEEDRLHLAEEDAPDRVDLLPLILGLLEVELRDDLLVTVALLLLAAGDERRRSSQCECHGRERDSLPPGHGRGNLLKRAARRPPSSTTKTVRQSLRSIATSACTSARA